MPDEARILTVGQLNDFAKMTLENNPVLNNVWVRGEISNFKHHFSGLLGYDSPQKDGRLLGSLPYSMRLEV